MRRGAIAGASFFPLGFGRSMHGVGAESVSARGFSDGCPVRIIHHGFSAPVDRFDQGGIDAAAEGDVYGGSHRKQTIISVPVWLQIVAQNTAGLWKRFCSSGADVA